MLWLFFLFLLLFLLLLYLLLVEDVYLSGWTVGNDWKQCANNESFKICDDCWINFWEGEGGWEVAGSRQSRSWLIQCTLVLFFSPPLPLSSLKSNPSLNLNSRLLKLSLSFSVTKKLSCIWLPINKLRNQVTSWLTGWLTDWLTD